MEEHECGQKTTLATICVKLENIESDVKEIKESQKMFESHVSNLVLDLAARPPSEVIKSSILKVDRHEIYFKIIWVALGGAWSILLIGIAIFLTNLTK